MTDKPEVIKCPAFCQCSAHPAPAATSAGTVAQDYYDPSTAEVPPVGHPLRKLGSYLAEILDEDRWATAEQHLLAAWAGTVAQEDDEATYQLGKRDGYEEAVQDIDVMTGGDGEYRYCTDGDTDRHTPDAATMKQRIADRLATLRAQLEEREAQLVDARQRAALAFASLDVRTTHLKSCEEALAERDEKLAASEALNAELEKGWLHLRQSQLVKEGMKIEQARIHAESQLASAKAALSQPSKEPL